MCGIVAIHFRKPRYRARSIEEAESFRDTFTKMLLDSQRRGSSATGVVASYTEVASAKKKVTVLRSPLPASEFVKSAEYQKILEKISPELNFIIGHTRAVTGDAPARNNFNNHPHRVGSVIGVHNGVIHNDTSLWNKLVDNDLRPAGTCDSEAIFGLLETARRKHRHNELLAASAQVLGQLQGWFALAFFNTLDPENLYLARDKNTDLNLVWLSEQRTHVIASEMKTVELGLEAFAKSTYRQFSLESNSVNRLACRPDNDSAHYVTQMKEIKPTFGQTIGKNDLELFNRTLGKN